MVYSFFEEITPWTHWWVPSLFRRLPHFSERLLGTLPCAVIYPFSLPFPPPLSPRFLWTLWFSAEFLKGIDFTDKLGFGLDFTYPPVGKTGMFDSSSNNENVSVDSTVKIYLEAGFLSLPASLAESQAWLHHSLLQICWLVQYCWVFGCGTHQVGQLPCWRSLQDEGEGRLSYTWLPMHHRLQSINPWNFWSMFRAQNDKETVMLDQHVNSFTTSRIRVRAGTENSCPVVFLR